MWLLHLQPPIPPSWIHWFQICYWKASWYTTFCLHIPYFINLHCIQWNSNLANFFNTKVDHGDKLEKFSNIDSFMKFGNYWIIPSNNVKFNDTGKNMTMCMALIKHITCMNSITYAKLVMHNDSNESNHILFTMWLKFSYIHNFHPHHPCCQNF